MFHKLLKEKFEELVAWVWNPSFAWVKQHWYKTVICYLLYSVTTNYEIEMWLFLYLELVSTVQQVRTGCTKIWSECPWSLHSRHVFKLWRNIVTFNSKLSFVCHMCNSIPDFVTPKGHSCLTAFIPKVKIFPYPKFSKSTLFMFCELHKTFIHPEFYCFHSIKIFVRNVCLNGSCKLWWCAWKRKALKNTKQNSEWKFDTWNWAENLKAARQPISFFFVSQWWHLLHTFLLRG